MTPVPGDSIKCYTVYCDTGDKLVLHGKGIEHAIIVAGLEPGVVGQHTVFYEEGRNNNYRFDHKTHEWIPREEK